MNHPAAAALGSSPLTRGKHRLPGRCHRRHGLIPAHAGKTASWSKSQPRSWAHPRSRGENAWLLGGAGARAGSSPLTRGKHVLIAAPDRFDGLIPAHAGKTQTQLPGEFPGRAHPRSRGENVTPGTRLVSVEGSSPLTRGKRTGVCSARLPRGLIPAHAGKTVLGAITGTINGAHPRSRGENPPDRRGPLASQGSSPLTRGKHPDDGADGDGLGLIPAHAGKTSSRRSAP